MPYRECRAAGHRKYQRDGQWFCRDCSVLEQQGRQEPPSLPWPDPVPPRVRYDVEPEEPERRVPVDVDPETPKPSQAA